MYLEGEFARVLNSLSKSFVQWLWAMDKKEDGERGELDWEVIDILVNGDSFPRCCEYSAFY